MLAQRVQYFTESVIRAYYVMTDIAALGDADDVEFVRQMIREVGVSAAPGGSFYNPRSLGRTKVRFMWAKRDETLHQAGERLPRLKGCGG